MPGQSHPAGTPTDRAGVGRRHPADGRTLGEGSPAFVGTGEAGSTVGLTDAGSIVCTATVDVAGKWTCTPGTALAEGEYTITATATDEAGNASRGGPITITVAPTTPVITTPADDGTLRRRSEHGHDAGERAGRGGCPLRHRPHKERPRRSLATTAPGVRERGVMNKRPS
ncbi:Ig-like domain-containing protein [Streptomyces sp. NPDC005125]